MKRSFDTDWMKEGKQANTLPLVCHQKGSTGASTTRRRGAIGKQRPIESVDADDHHAFKLTASKASPVDFRVQTFPIPRDPHSPPFVKEKSCVSEPKAHPVCLVEEGPVSFPIFAKQRVESHPVEVVGGDKRRRGKETRRLAHPVDLETPSHPIKFMAPEESRPVVPQWDSSVAVEAAGPRLYKSLKLFGAGFVAEGAPSHW
jgi:hypothetical protein